MLSSFLCLFAFLNISSSTGCFHESEIHCLLHLFFTFGYGFFQLRNRFINLQFFSSNTSHWSSSACKCIRPWRLIPFTSSTLPGQTPASVLFWLIVLGNNVMLHIMSDLFLTTPVCFINGFSHTVRCHVIGVKDHESVLHYGLPCRRFV